MMRKNDKLKIKSWQDEIDLDIEDLNSGKYNPVRDNERLKRQLKRGYEMIKWSKEKKIK